MGGALDSFRDELKRADDFRDRAIKVGLQAFDDDVVRLDATAARFRLRAADAAASKDERNAAASKDERNAAASLVSEGEDEARNVRSVKKPEWERDVLRVWVLRLVTAFEMFLRQIVIEKASSRDQFVHDFLKTRDGLDLPTPVNLAGLSDAADRVEACVDKTHENFSNLETASDYFYSWFGRRFWNKNETAGPLNTPVAKRNAMDDVSILFQLRHILVHKGGVPNKKYQDTLLALHDRLDGRVCDVTAREVQPPDAIVSSRPMDVSNPTKKEELHQSLHNLAEHIDALYP